VDAKAMLRRYLEQRRELGESELVLDSLHVDEVMQLLGAAGRPTAQSRRPSLRELAEEIASEEIQDWRTSLRQAGVNVDAAISAKKPVVGAASTETEFPETTSPETTTEMAFKKGIVVAADEAELIPSAIDKLESLEEIAKKVKKCTRCPLYETANNPVPGEGDSKAELVCVGEADRVAKPGPAIAAAKRAPLGELQIYPGVDHFDIYDGPQLEAVIADQLDFLRRHLS